MEGNNMNGMFTFPNTFAFFFKPCFRKIPWDSYPIAHSKNNQHFNKSMLRIGGLSFTNKFL